MNATNLPQPRTLEWYTDLTNRFAELALRYPHTIGVYTGGTVSEPGISDLDFLLCLDDTLTTPCRIEEELTDEMKTALSGGTILKVNVSNMASVHLIDDFPLTPIAGAATPIKQYAGELFELCRIFDWLPERYATLKKLQAARELDVTNALQFLKSVTVSLEKLAAVTGYESRAFSSAVVNLRKKWFEYSAKDGARHLEQRLHEAGTVLHAALIHLDQWVTTKKLIQTAQAEDVSWQVPGGPSFTSNDTPPTVFAFLAEQAKRPNFIAQHIAASFSGTVPTRYTIAPELTAVIQQRQAYVESLAQFFLNNNLTSGLLKYGWFLYAHQTT